MIDLLNTGNIYTLKGLSEKIGVTERMVRYYKNKIESLLLLKFNKEVSGYSNK